MLLVGMQVVLEFILNLLGLHARVIFDVLHIQCRLGGGGVELLFMRLFAFL